MAWYVNYVFNCSTNAPYVRVFSCFFFLALFFLSPFLFFPLLLQFGRCGIACHERSHSHEMSETGLHHPLFFCFCDGSILFWVCLSSHPLWIEDLLFSSKHFFFSLHLLLPLASLPPPLTFAQHSLPFVSILFHFKFASHMALFRYFFSRSRRFPSRTSSR